MEKLLTTKQVAEMLDLSDTKVRRLVRDKAIKAANFAAKGSQRKTYRFRKEWIEEFISASVEKSARKTESRASGSSAGGRY